jgi:hypothetical protein
VGVVKPVSASLPSKAVAVVAALLAATVLVLEKNGHHSEPRVIIAE